MRLLIRITKYIVLIFLSIILLLSLILFRGDISYVDAIDLFSEEESEFFETDVLGLDQKNHEITIHYLDYGHPEDTPIVLLHGAFSSALTFEPWKDELIQNGYRVILVDLPYHGLSTGFGDQVTSIRRSAEVVMNLLTHLNISSFYIGGNSMGGGVSWYLTGTYHGVNQVNVLGLILIDSIYPTNASGAPESGFINVLSSDLVAPLVSKMTPRFFFKQLLNGVYGSYTSPSDQVIDRYYSMLRVNGHRLSILQNSSEDISTEDQMTILEKIVSENIPVLILWGEEDTWISVETTELFKETLDLAAEDIIIYPDLGHVPMEEDPERTILDVIDFLES